MLRKPELSDGFSRKILGVYLFLFLLFFFKATSGLSCGTWDLHCCMQESFVLG